MVSTTKHPARHAALSAMRLVTAEGQTLDEALSSGERDLPPEIRAEARRIATGAFRFAARSDRMVGPYLRRKPGEEVLNIFRMALYELNEAGTPPHAAVDGAVSLTVAKQKGLVNAVLRNIARDDVVWAEVPNPLTKWLRKRLVKAWGEDAVQAMEGVFSTTPPLDLTVKGDAAVWSERLDGTVLPTGSVRMARVPRVTGLDGYDAGEWWVQDAAAALPARLLNAKPGEAVLDLCAAPGGKTLQLAATGAIVTALDVSKRRMQRVAENLTRTGLSAEMVAADALTWEAPAPFDAILLDAPCSATGTLRRHPELPFARNDAGLDEIIALQAAMIDRAVTWLKPGGRLVFCTCSLLPEEGEAQVDAALSRTEGLSVAMPEVEWIDPRWRVDHGLRIRPDHWAERGGIDGFFISVLHKPG